MEKLYTDEEYITKSIEATEKKEQLYIHQHSVEYDVEVLEYNYEEKQEVQIVVDPETGEEKEEIVTVKVPTTPKMVLEKDEEGNIVEVQAHHTETRTKEVQELLIAPYNYYICFKDNYTDGTINENYETETERAEKERIAKLHLTAADVERGIYQAKDMDFDDILALVMTNPPTGLDIKRLKIELKANYFYRGNPYVEAIGKMLGFTDKQLTRFFETNDYKELLYADNTGKKSNVRNEVPPKGI